MHSKLHLKWLTFSGLLKAFLTYLLAKFSKHPLPPGNLANLYTQESEDQTYLLKKFESHGPVMMIRTSDFLVICVLGLDRCRKLLSEQNDNLVGLSFDIKPVTPLGFMREMEGETHKKYRTILIKGIQPDAMEIHRNFHRSIIAKNLSDYASNHSQNPSAQDFINTLDSIGQSILLHLFFGAEYGTGYHTRLTDIFKKMWDKDWLYYMKDHQLAAYEELKEVLLNSLEENDDPTHSMIQDSIMGRIHESGSLDETILANLIYMVETGRFAVYSLMRWATKYAVDNPDVYNRISTDPKTLSNEKDCIAQAFVQETLRLNQIERLLRHIKKSFVFEGFLFPKGAQARLCLWESHKSPAIFKNPMTFNPQRFLDNQFSLIEYAPFGLGSHRCPLGAVSMQICRLYLYYLSSNYSLEAIGNGPPIRGIAHYEPAREFTVKLHKRH